MPTVYFLYLLLLFRLYLSVFLYASGILNGSEKHDFNRCSFVGGVWLSKHALLLNINLFTICFKAHVLTEERWL